METVCNNCGKQFARPFTLRRHIKNKVCFIQATQTILCNVCKIEIPQDIYDKHIRSHQRRYTCRQCNTKFDTKYALCIHQKETHKQGTAIKCRQCNISFPDRKQFYKHHATTHLLGGAAPLQLQKSPFDGNSVAPWLQSKDNSPQSKTGVSPHIAQQSVSHSKTQRNQSVNFSPEGAINNAPNVSDGHSNEVHSSDNQSAISTVFPPEGVADSSSFPLEGLADSSSFPPEGVAHSSAFPLERTVDPSAQSSVSTDVADHSNVIHSNAVHSSNPPEGASSAQPEVDENSSLLRETWEINKAHILMPHKIGKL